MQAAVKIIATRLDCGADNTAAGVAKFSVIRVGIDLELAHRVNLRDGGSLVVIRPGIGGTIDQDFVGPAAPSIDAEIVGLVLADRVVARDNAAARRGRADGSGCYGDQEQGVACQ